MKIIDISHPIHNRMWSYRPEWMNKVDVISSTKNGDNSTVYKFELCSHTGTYIETSQHKLQNDILLEHFDIERFICKVKLIKLNINSKRIRLKDFLNELELNSIVINKGDEVVICTGWGEESNNKDDFIINAPFFEEDLTEYISKKCLNLLGVDTPVIDNQAKPYSAVNKLFKNNDNLLLLAPLYIMPSKVKTGSYILNALPLKITGVSASLCRPVLIENYMNSD